MKNKKLLGKNMTFLIVGILAVLAFTKETTQFWGLIGVFTVWAIWTVIIFITKKRRFKKTINKRMFSETMKMFKGEEPESSSSAAKENSDAVLLRHLNCRISDYLKSVYPAVTWEWISENPVKLAEDNGTGKIRLFGITDYNYADIKFDNLGRIDCKMIKIVSFGDLKKTSEPKSENESAPDKQPNQPVDPETWYGIQGKKILEECVADLNARGHANLIIKENGDICVKQENKETVCEKFKNLPGKSLWQQLVKIIETQGLSASVTNDVIKVSW